MIQIYGGTSRRGCTSYRCLPEKSLSLSLQDGRSPGPVALERERTRTCMFLCLSPSLCFALLGGVKSGQSLLSASCPIHSFEQMG